MYLAASSRRPTRCTGSEERGIILLLTMFVLFLVIALITQLSLGAEVAHQTTANRSSHIQMDLACRTTAEEVFTMLKDDASGEASGGFSSALAGPGAFADLGGLGGDARGGDVGANGTADAGAGAADAGADGADAEAAEEDGSNADSFEDPWAKAMRVVVGDVEVTTYVEDENGKFNLHLLLVEDEAEREANRERAIRILDALRNDFEDDLADSDARRIIDDLMRWMEVDSRSRELPLMPRFSLEEDAQYTMLSSLEEMMLLQSVPQSLFYDQLRSHERIAPGIESVFTIWTLPAFTEAGVDRLAADAPADGSANSSANGSADSAGDAVQDAAEKAGAGSSSFDAGSSSAGIESPTGPDSANGGEPAVQGEGGMEGVLEGDPPIGTLININTAPRAVVEGMFPSAQLPPVKISALLEYRNKVDEKALEDRTTADEEPEDRELRESVYGEDEEDPKQFFRSLEQLSEVDGFAAEQIDEDTQAELQNLLGVQSDIFSVYVFAYLKIDAEWEPERRYEEPPGHALRMKAVVWRRTTADGVKLVYLDSWHEVPYTRWRLPDFQRDLPPFEPPRYR